MLGRGWCHGNPWPSAPFLLLVFGLSFQSCLPFILWLYPEQAWGKKLGWEHSHIPAAFSRSGTNSVCGGDPTLPHALSKPPLCSLTDFGEEMELTAVFLLPMPCWGGQDSGAGSDAALQAARIWAKYIPYHCPCHSQLRSESCCLSSEETGAWLCCLKLAEKMYITDVSN